MSTQASSIGSFGAPSVSTAKKRHDVEKLAFGWRSLIRVVACGGSLIHYIEVLPFARERDD